MASRKVSDLLANMPETVKFVVLLLIWLGLVAFALAVMADLF